MVAERGEKSVPGFRQLIPVSCRTGIFGGTFDPPHLAHLAIARIVFEAGLVDRVMMVPCLRHAFPKAPVAFVHRLEMCRRMTGRLPYVEVSDVEREMQRPGRTLELVEVLKKKYPERTFRLVVGADIYLERHKWHRFDLIEQKAPPIFLARAGVDVNREGWLKAPPDISSTELRRRLEMRESLDGLLDESVMAYIVEHQLYGV